jgi:hypothetical protein
MDIRQPLITANNSVQNLGEVRHDRANALGNLSVENPTIEQFNAGIQGAGTSNGPPEPSPEPEPAFGEHIHEAIGVVRRALS